MALESTRPLTKMSTRNISLGDGGKGGWCIALTTLPPSYADCLEILEPQPPGTLWACNRLVQRLLYLQDVRSGVWFLVRQDTFLRGGLNRPKLKVDYPPTSLAEMIDAVPPLHSLHVPTWHAHRQTTVVVFTDLLMKSDTGNWWGSNRDGVCFGFL